jgi:tripartite-type tricarboxylate transporter receptor subunit TctC
MKRLMKILVVICFMSSFNIPSLSAREEYPTKLITIVVPFSPGSHTDLGARILASFLSKSLGQPVVILNRPGGGATVGGNVVATAKPDGYTLGFLPLSPSMPESYSYFLGAPYTSKDLRPVSRILSPVATISVKADAPWKSIKDLIEDAKKNPGMKYGTTGPGSSPHIMMVTIEKAEGVKFTNVTFPGDLEIVPAILGGHIPFGLPHYNVTVKSNVEAGDLRVLAIYLQKRFELIPNVPTFAELGYKIPYYPFFGVFAPKETPDVIVKKLDRTIEKVKDDPEFVEKVKNLCIPITYESTESFRNSIVQYKANIDLLFKELGYVKQ